MKPIELHLQAFGQYLHPQTVRFDKLDSVFLIAGETGAGKTTLFDAMSYALYGIGLGARGGKNSGGKLRSQLAADDVSTVVRFQFAVRGVVWQVERSPYQFSGRNRKGEAQSEKYVTLQRLTGPQAPETVAPAEADEMICQLLGLRHADFAKILVLPQGEFQKFLEMESDERGELLKKLFPVDEHVAMAAAAKTAAAEATRRIEDADTVIKEMRKKVDAAAFAAEEQALVDAVAALRAEEDSKQQAARAAHEELRAAEALEKQIGQLASESVELAVQQAQQPAQQARQQTVEAAQRAAAVVPVLETAARLAQEWQALRDKVGTSQEAEREAQRTVDGLQPSLHALPVREAALRDAQLAAGKLQDRVDELAKLAEARRNVSAAEKRDVAAKADAAKGDEAVAAAKTALAELDRLAAERERAQPDLAAADANVAQCKLAEPDAKAVAEWSRRQPALSEEIARAEAELAALRAKVVHAQTACDAARDRIRRNAALAVAAALQPGEPCGACGSREHPNPCRGDREDADLLAIERLAAVGLQSAQDASTAQDRLAAQLRTTLTLQSQAAGEAEKRLQQAGFADPAAWRAALMTRQARQTELREADAAVANRLAQRPKLNAELRDREAALVRLQAAAGRCGEELAAAQGKVADLVERLGEVADAADAQREAQEQLTDARATNTKESQAIEALRRQGQDAAHKLTEARAQREGLQSQCDDRAQRAPAAQKAADEALAAHQFADAATARNALRPPAQLHALQEEIVKWQSRLEVRLATIGSLQAAIGDRSAPDLAALGLLREQADAAAKLALEARAGRENDLTALRRRHAELTAKIAEREKLQAESGGLVTLAKHLNGDIAPKIDFATWMLTWWLEQVLTAANRRMSALSDSRYSFALRTTVQDRRTRAGLDMDVVDSWSNQRRDVKSLSGGEKFLASLSLALGLADVVQSRNAGVQLDTLFIDEGFGGLDPTMLDRAMELVNSVAEHRSVGIISHVEAMQKAIVSQIRVAKSPRGSTVAVVGAGL